jgi:hypothetical protein
VTAGIPTVRVIRDAAGAELLHLPRPGSIGNFTACGVLLPVALIEDRPVTWAGVWCSACMAELIGTKR